MKNGGQRLSEMHNRANKVVTGNFHGEIERSGLQERLKMLSKNELEPERESRVRIIVRALLEIEKAIRSCLEEDFSRELRPGLITSRTLDFMGESTELFAVNDEEDGIVIEFQDNFAQILRPYGPNLKEFAENEGSTVD